MIGLVVWACGPQGGRPVEMVTADSVPPEVSLSDTTPPAARAGFLAARTEDPGQISGEWPAAAGACADPTSLHILADGDTVGVLMVLIPLAGNAAVTYQVTPSGSGPPQPGTARMGVQRILFTGVAYAADEGTVRVTRFDRRISGQFSVRLVDAASGRPLRYAGSFRDLHVKAWPADFCALTPADSLPLEPLR
ncbi:MAG TPA: hypothetical protein VD793_11145 [Gemmatimonadales bacterium]|nr:hypothetical protein [Gemmatimonadales bacterium]